MKTWVRLRLRKLFEVMTVNVNATLVEYIFLLLSYFHRYPRRCNSLVPACIVTGIIIDQVIYQRSMRICNTTSMR